MNLMNILAFVFSVLCSSTVCEDERVFNCNFDTATNINQQCGGSSLTSLSGSSATIVVANDVTASNGPNTALTITDVKSISTPTVNTKQLCRLPFQYKGNEFNFCAQNLSRYVCEVTPEGDFDQCILGNFLRVRTTGVEFSTSFNLLSEIALPAAGKYKLSIYTLIYCPRTDCESTNDFLSVKMKEGTNEFEEIFKVGFEDGRIRDRKWVPSEVEFTTKTRRINLRIDFQRIGSLANAQGNLAVDEISIYRLGDGEIQTTVPITTTTSNTISSSLSTVTTSTTTTTVSSLSSSTMTTTTTNASSSSSSSTVNDPVSTQTEPSSVTSSNTAQQSLPTSELSLVTSVPLTDEPNESATTKKITTTTPIVKTTTTTTASTTGTTKRALSVIVVQEKVYDKDEMVFLGLFIPVIWILAILSVVFYCYRKTVKKNTKSKYIMQERIEEKRQEMSEIKSKQEVYV